MPDLDKAIRPWWRGPGPFDGHIFANCPVLLGQDEAREGVGWLDPYGDHVCTTCFDRYDPAESWERNNDDY